MNPRLQIVSIRRQGGFVQAIALALVLVISVGSMLWRANQSSSGAEDQSVRADASSLIVQAGNLANGFAVMIMNNVDLGKIAMCEENDLALDCTTAAAGHKGLYNPVEGSVSRQTPPSSAIGAAGIEWALKSADDVAIPGIGTSNGDWVVFAPRVKDAICRQINYQILGKPASGQFDSPVLRGMNKVDYDLAGGFMPHFMDWTIGGTIAIAAMTGAIKRLPAAGCVSAGAVGTDSNVFYQVVKAE